MVVTNSIITIMIVHFFFFSTSSLPLSLCLARPALSLFFCSAKWSVVTVCTFIEVNNELLQEHTHTNTRKKFRRNVWFCGKIEMGKQNGNWQRGYPVLIYRSNRLFSTGIALVIFRRIVKHLNHTVLQLSRARVRGLQQHHHTSDTLQLVYNQGWAKVLYLIEFRFDWNPLT